MSLPNDAQRIVEGLAKIESPNPNYDDPYNKKRCARQLVRKHYQFKTASVAANAALVANVSEKIEMHANGRVIAAVFNPDTTLDVSANAANYATIAARAIYARAANGDVGNGVVGNTLASATLRPTANGGTGNLVVGGGYALTVDPDACRFSRGQALGPGVAQTAGGIAVPAGSWTFHTEEEGPDFSESNVAGWAV